MVTTPTDQGPRRTLPLPVKLLLFAGLPILFVAMIVAAVAAAVPLLSGTSVDLDYRAPAAPAVRVSVPDARLDFVPADGDEVLVRVTGRHTGPAPELRVATVGDETLIEGGCPRQWFTICTLRVRVALPADADLSVTGTNGAISVEGHTGELDLGTTNGRIELDGVSGPVTAVTTNGDVRLADGASERVSARTTNGGVELHFAAAPLVVEARSTNGGIGIRLPDDGESYFLDAQTTNGGVGGDVESDRRADRTVTARTTNGGITIDWAD
ncbi:DUF4097 family beta strand repeat-containing protein [Naasia sp. SYSU D00057]|uniref:DUF4097 family beta strand repeat-containing protein n=1 Tax=Naasia sp. SYSU D00057 TaxID=2817380 RepID=UPI001B3159D8|nr:DUF4097 family beta strand repeat-containing protein [Naasia sp. SYSU D00057]